MTRSKIQVTDTDEMDAFFAVITSTDETGAPMENVSISTLSYEAEDAELIGGARAYDKVGWSTFAASGRKDVGNINNNGDGVRFTVNVPEDGMYDVGLFYSLQAPYVDAQTLEPDANGQNRAIGHTLPYGMQVDDGDVNTIYLESTVVWNYRRHYNTDVYLTEGDHTITFTQINGDEGDKGNLQLVAAIDKLDLDLIESEDTRYDFEIDMSEQTNFKEGNVTKVTAIAPIAGYYNVSGEGGFTLTRQSVDYASDAKTYSDVNVYDVEIGNTVYLSQGANTIGVTGDVGVLNFEYDAVKTEQNSVVIDAEDMAIHGTNAYYKENEYAESGSVVTELGIGQNEEDSANAEDNYIEFNVNAPSEGMYNFAIRYANDEPAPVMLKSDGSTYVHPYNIDLVERYAQISVNGGEPETVYFRNTMSWETFREVDVQLRLSEGDNIIRIYNDNSYQFSELVNSTAPEIDTITVSRQSWDGTSVTVSSEQGVIDTSMLDVVIAEAERKLDQNDVYSETSLNELKAALERVVRDTQSGVNRSYNDVKDAIDALKPISLDLSEYYITSYASTSVGTPSNSFDGDTSTVWTTDRSTSPYVAYEVFYAGDGKVFDLEEIEMQGDTNTKVMYLGTNSDDILKDPVSMGVADQDLCKKDSELYRPFAQLYSADILGTANGADVTTQLSGQYRYLIVAAYVWEVTNVSELTLSATVEDTDGIEADIEIVQDTDGMNAEFNIKYNNTGELPKAYFAGYDETGKLISLDTAQVEGDHLSLELASGAKKYKAFLWDDDQVPLAAAVSYNE